MNKSEIRKAVNKAVFEFAESLGYMVDDHGEGGRVTFVKHDAKTIDDSIEYSRSQQSTCTLNWASSKIKADETKIEKFIERIVKTIK
jgi:hypothetical protein